MKELNDLEKEDINGYVRFVVSQKSKDIKISDCRAIAFEAMHLYVKRELYGLASEVLCTVLAIVLEAGKLDTNELFPFIKQEEKK